MSLFSRFILPLCVFLISLIIAVPVARAVPDGEGNEILVGNVGIGTVSPVGGLTVMNGNVGIGTWSPVAALEVVGGIQTNSLAGRGASNNTYMAISGDVISFTINGSGRGYWSDSILSIPTTLGWNADSDTSISLAGSNTLRLTTGGVERFRVNSAGSFGIGTTTPVGGTAIMNGNVGIGTWSPTAALEVVGAVAATTFSGDGSGLTGIGGAWTDGGTNIFISNDFTNNVGIGTTTPSASLEIVDSGAAPLMVSSTATGDGDVLIVDSTGNIGIGSVSPSQRLAIAQSADSDGLKLFGYDDVVDDYGHLSVNALGYLGIDVSSLGILSEDGTAALRWRSGYLAVTDDTELGFGLNLDYSMGFHDADDTWRFVDGGDIRSNVRMSMNNAGNIGIGTYHAEAVLEIAEDGITPFMVSSSDGAGDGDMFIVDASGNVGIGSLTPGASLDVMGTIRHSGVSNNDSGIYGLASSTHIFSLTRQSNDLSIAAFGGVGFDTNQTSTDPDATYAMFLDTAGRVGIGTTTPSGALTVMNGNVGIGTWSPTGSLQVVGGDVKIGLGTFDNPSANNDLYVTGNIQADGSIFLADGTELNDSGDLGAASGWTDDGGVVRLDTQSDYVGIGTTLNAVGTKLAVMAGNVGIGTWNAWNARLTVAGGIHATHPTNGAGLSVTSTATSGGVGSQYGGILSLIEDDNAAMGNAQVLGSIVFRGARNASNSVATGAQIAGLSDENWGGATSAGRLVMRTATSGSLSNLVSRMEIDSNGNVGIGTSRAFNGTAIMNGNVGIGTWKPAQELDVKGSVGLRSPTNGAQTVQLFTTGSHDGALRLYDTGSVRTHIVAQGDSYLTGTNIGIGTTTPVGALAVMSGNVGIGTWKPAVGLHVGRGGSRTYATDENDLFVLDDIENDGLIFTPEMRATEYRIGGTQMMSGTTPLILGAQITAIKVRTTATDNIMWFAADGNVGVGTSGPRGKLEVVGGDLRVGLGTFNNPSVNYDIYTTGNLEVDGSIFLADGTELNDSGDLGGATGWTDDGSIVRLDTQSDLVGIGTTLNSVGTKLAVMAGNVGIGTWSADEALTVRGTARIAGQSFYVGRSGTSGQIYGGNPNPGGSLQLFGGTSANSFLTLNSTTGIAGTADYVSLNVGGNSALRPGIRITNTSGIVNVGIGTATPQGALIVWTGNVGIGTTTPVGGTAIMNGNVGIGTWKPESALEVIGTVAADAFVGDGSGLTGVVAAGGWTDEGARVYATTTTDNVGIGTVNPVANLHVGGSTGGALLLTRQDATTQNNEVLGEIRFDSIDGNVSSSDAPVVIRATSSESYSSTEKGAYLSFLLKPENRNANESALERLRITDAGNVGIGTTRPAGGLVVMNGNVGIGTWKPVASLDLIGKLSVMGSSSHPTPAAKGLLTLSKGFNAPTTVSAANTYMQLGYTESAANGLWLIGFGYAATNMPGYIGYTTETNANFGSGALIFGTRSVTTDTVPTERMRINAAGNVGIGTTTPIGALSVMSGNVGIGTWSPTGSLQVVGGDVKIGLGTFDNPSANFDLYVTGNIQADGSIFLADGTEINDSGDLGGATGWTDDGDVVRLDTAANRVGIGTTTPSAITGLSIMNGNVGIGTWNATSALRVAGAISSTSSISSGSSITASSTITATSIMNVQNSGTALVINPTNSAGASLAVKGGIRADSRLFLISTAGTGTSDYIALGVGTNGGTEAMRVITDGNIGIGTSKPYASLAIASTAAAADYNSAGTGDVYIQNDLEVDGTIYGTFSGDGSALTGVSGTWTDAGGYVFIADDYANNVGIGTNTPTALLNISSTAAYDLLRVDDNGPGDGSPFVVTAAGNVGIGTSSPKRPLDVNGIINVGNSNLAGTLGFTFGGRTDHGFFPSTNDAYLSSLESLRLIIDSNNNGANDYFSIGRDGNGMSAGAELFRVLSNGNVGIGTANPRGSLIVASGSVGIGTFDPVGGTAIMNGNVGIGTWSPTGQLQVVGGDVKIGLGTFDNPSANNDFYVTGNIQADGSIFLADGTELNDSGDLGGGSGAWMDGGTNVFVASDYTNNVGIGTATPDAALEIVEDGGGTPFMVSDNYAGNGDFLIIGANGNVGIGTNSPQQLLSLRSPTGVNNYVEIDTVDANDGTSNAGLSLQEAGVEKWRILNIGNTSDKLSFMSSNASHRVVLDQSGNMGIGTTLPGGALTVMSGNVGIGTWKPQSRLQINGMGSTSGLTLMGTNSGRIYIESDNILHINRQGAPSLGMALANSGNVGIGTTTPINKFSVYGAYSSAGFPTVGGFYDSTAAGLDVGAGIALGGLADQLRIFGMVKGGHESSTASNYAGYLSFLTRVNGNAAAMTERMRITSSGNVGIGTWVPGGTLELIKSGTNVKPLLVSSSQTADGDFFTMTSSGNVGIGTSTPVGGFTVMSGNVGIGTWSPTGSLQVVGGDVKIGLGTFDNPSANFDLYVTGNIQADGSIFLADGTELNDSGDLGGGAASGWTDGGTNVYTSASTDNVGIGTTTPLSLLEVTSTAAYDLLRINDSGVGDATPFVVTADGRVGIGTSSPSQELVVDGHVQVANGSQYRFGQSDGAGNGSSSIAGSGFNNAADYVGLITRNIERLRVDSVGGFGIGTTMPVGGTAIMNGNVGIGTWSPTGSLQVVGGDVKIGLGTFDNPSANFDLYVTGNIQADGSIFLADGTELNDSGDLGGGSGAWTDGGTNIFVSDDFTNNVGIGTTTPTAQLHVRQTNAANALYVEDEAVDASPFVVRADGNVGIGTATPSNILSIYRNQNTITTLAVGNNNTGNAAESGLTLSTTGGIAVLSTLGAGHAGYGTQQSRMTALYTNAASGINFMSESATGHINFTTGNNTNERMRIAANGNIGIGTTTPTSKLNISGNLSVGSGGAYRTLAAPPNGLQVEGSVGIGTVLPVGGLAVMNGNVGIGTWSPTGSLQVTGGDVKIGMGTFDNPSANFDLYVTGNIQADGSIFLADGTELNDSGDLGGGSGAWTDGGTNVFVTSDYTNNVGIGTTTPSTTLEIVKQGTNAPLMVSATPTGDGDLVIVSASGNVGLGTTTPLGAFIVMNGNVGIGTTKPYGRFEVAGLFQSYSDNLYIGEGAGNFSSTGDNNVAVGGGALSSLDNTGGNSNVAVGHSALTSLDNGDDNVAIGRQAMIGLDTGDANVAIGSGALSTSDGSNSIAIGYGALDAANADNNIALGFQAGDNITSGTNNIIIGHDVDAPGAAVSNRMVIGNLLYGTGVDGSGAAVSSGNIGIGTATPGGRFVVWSGNVGIGTTTPVGGTAVMNGNVGIGTWSPRARMEVNNSVSFSSEHDNGTDADAFTIDWRVANKQKITLGGAAQDVTFTDPGGVANLLLKVVQDGTGSRTVDWSNETSINWPGGVAPTLSTAAAAVDFITCYFDGTDYFCTASLNFQ